MFCGNCGKQNPDGAKFCSNCGSALNAAPVQQTPVYQAPVYQAPPVQQQAPVQKPAPAKKKSGAIGRILISIVSFFVVSALATVLVQSFSSAPDIENDGVTSAAYSQVFYDNGLAVPSGDYGADVKTTAYVLDGGNGMVENIEYAYSKGYIVSYVDTIYVPVAGMDDATRREMDAYIQESFSHLTYVSCCDITVEYGSDFYIYRQVFTGLNKENNVRQLVGAGIVTASSNGEIKKIGMKTTEEGLLASGYIKR